MDTDGVNSCQGTIFQGKNRFRNCVLFSVLILRGDWNEEIKQEGIEIRIAASSSKKHIGNQLVTDKDSALI